MRYLLLATLLAGCGPGSWWHRQEVKAWEKHGACSVVCDYRQGYMSAVLTISPTECRCITPTLQMFNDARASAGLQPLDTPNVTLTCDGPGGCEYEALRICAHQPWRCPEDLPLPGSKK